MTPFRERPVKWDGRDSNGRYKDKDGYKFDIVTKTVVKKPEDMPLHFLADTPEEAESIYARFQKMVNDFAYSYAMSTNLNRMDLFGEALIGLARAYRDWDPSRSENFGTYARFVIKDALNEFVRDNLTIVSMPAYVKKANINLKNIKSICAAYNIDWRILVIDQEIPQKLDMSDAIKCSKSVSNLIQAAKRAKVDYEKFIDRVALIPEDIEYVDQTPFEVHKRESEMCEAAMIVEKLKEHMDKYELFICTGIMEDKSFEEIGKEMKKSKSWVSGKLKNLRERIVSMMEEGTL
jgi:RNA polymerase sigma factor (sigma-70 family)